MAARELRCRRMARLSSRLLPVTPNSNGSFDDSFGNGGRLQFVPIHSRCSAETIQKRV